MVNTNPQKIKKLLTRNVGEVVVKEDLIKKLESGRVLRVKHGVDPTSKDLHLGHAVAYWKLREFQEMGHKIVFLIGDFTARFGDPTDQASARKLRPKKEVSALAENYLAQAGKILDMDKVEVRRNSEWYDKWSFEDGLCLMSRFTAARMLERDMFQERIKKGQEIHYHEPIYPMLQGYDSVELKADLTVIGTEQKFNELVARAEQEKVGQTPQDLVIVPLLLGLDGKQKMSQSRGNQIGLNDLAQEMYGKAMSLPDGLILHYLNLATRLSEKEIKAIELEMKSGANPKEAKARLAFEIVKLYRGPKSASQAAQDFEKVFKHKEMPSDMPEIKIKGKKLSILDLLVEIKLAPSKSEAKRLIEQGAVKIDKKVVKGWKEEVAVKDKMVVQAGRRRFVKIAVV